jgi:hypothetical protein
LKRRVFRPRGSLTMRPEDREFLNGVYRDDIQHLEELTGRDLRAWRGR